MALAALLLWITDKPVLVGRGAQCRTGSRGLRRGPTEWSRGLGDTTMENGPDAVGVYVAEVRADRLVNE